MLTITRWKSGGRLPDSLHPKQIAQSEVGYGCGFRDFAYLVDGVAVEVSGLLGSKWEVEILIVTSPRDKTAHGELPARIREFIPQTFGSPTLVFRADLFAFRSSAIAVPRRTRGTLFCLAHPAGEWYSRLWGFLSACP